MRCRTTDVVITGFNYTLTNVVLTEAPLLDSHNSDHISLLRTHFTAAGHWHKQHNSQYNYHIIYSFNGNLANNKRPMTEKKCRGQPEIVSEFPS